MTSYHYIIKKNLSEKSVGYKQSIGYLSNYGNLVDKAVIEERGALVYMNISPICRSKNNDIAITAVI